VDQPGRRPDLGIRPFLERPSFARFDDYGFVALDVTPAAAGQRTTMVLRFINEQGRELDRVVFNRVAGG
jgi:hypothetical protein